MIELKDYGFDIKTLLSHQMTIEQFYTNGFDPDNVKLFSVRVLGPVVPTPFFNIESYELILKIIKEEQENERNNR